MFVIFLIFFFKLYWNKPLFAIKQGKRQNKQIIRKIIIHLVQMPIYCFVPECRTIGTNGLHRFPADPELRKKWMEKTKTLYLGPSKNAKICRKHFKETDLLIDIDGKKRLAPNAVPCLFLPQPIPSSLDHNYSLVCCL